MDIRLRSLSYSSRLALHRCPRFYQLQRLNAKESNEETLSQSVTFAFGHTVGLGIQEYITHHNEDETIWKCFLMWEADLLADNPKQNKSFWKAIAAVQRFISMCKNGFMEHWQLAFYDGKPATELSFIIKFPDGFTYKGFVDAVLVHKHTREIRILECKTTSGTFVSPAMYKNSAQAIGYSIVLDALFPTLSSYEVQYLVYKSKGEEYDVMAFEKSYLQRALWIREVLLDIDIIKMYEETGIYPQYGESCFEFYSECSYLGTCGLSTELITESLEEAEEKEIERKLAEGFQITLTLQDLIKSQLAKESP